MVILVVVIWAILVWLWLFPKDVGEWIAEVQYAYQQHLARNCERSEKRRMSLPLAVMIAMLAVVTLVYVSIKQSI